MKLTKKQFEEHAVNLARECRDKADHIAAGMLPDTPSRNFRALLGEHDPVLADLLASIDREALRIMNDIVRHLAPRVEN